MTSDNDEYRAVARASRANSPAATPRERLELAHSALCALLGTMRDYAREAQQAAIAARTTALIGSEAAKLDLSNQARALEIEDEVQQCQRTASRIGRLLGVEP